jgi:DNA ligase (NAD+)
MSSTKIEELAKEILRHKKLYYRGIPEISDWDFDKLEDSLRQLDPDNVVLQMVEMEDE